MSYSVITPYIIPPELQQKKVVNIGDGFILNSLGKLLIPSECNYLFTSRKSLSENDIHKINSTKALILAGANQLNDKYTIVPGMNASTLDKINIPIIPFGIGIHGIENQNQRMSEATKDIFKLIHERIKFSSWRCPLTIEYLHNNLPELASKFLLTGCPVIYDDKLLNSSKLFSTQSKNIIVTVTERLEFWDREVKTIDFVFNNYPKSGKIISLHQDFLELENRVRPRQNDILKKIKIKVLRKYDKTPFSLREYARHKGFKIFKPTSVDECFNFYNNCEMHIGSRLHAHLYFISQAKKSFLTYVDERCTGFSKLLQFPICDFNHLEKYLDYNFDLYRSNSIKNFEVMQQFVRYLKEDIL